MWRHAEGIIVISREVVPGLAPIHTVFVSGHTHSSRCIKMHIYILQRTQHRNKVQQAVTERPSLLLLHRTGTFILFSLVAEELT